MNHTIVLIDDNFSIRQIVKIFLAKISHRYALDLKVFTSDNGVEGLGFVFITTPSLVIIDTTLPKYSGREVLDFLVHNPKFHSDLTKVIVLHEGEQKNLNLPKNFSIINKNDKDSFKNFSELVFNILNISDPSHSDDLFNKLSRFVLKNSNQDDLLNKSIEQQPLFKRFFLRFKWTWLELSTSLVLTLIILLFGRADDENITQQDIDKKAFRTKYYPTLVVTFISLTIIFINLGLFFTSQISLMNDVRIQSTALTTFVVDSTADTNDFSDTDDLCDTDDSVGDGPCTLRAAIVQANATAGTDTINFNIPGAGVHTLSPSSNYAAITESIIIDGTTEAGANCSTSTLVIEIDGTGILGGSDALAVSGLATKAVTIKGLVIQNFNDSAIVLTGGSGSTATITCNIIGLDSDKVTTNPNQNGILVGDNFNATIGGATASDRNIISGNTNTGIQIFSSGTATIQGNYIGTAASGTIDKGNAIGIQANTGATTISNNVISYNDSAIRLHGAYTDNYGPLDILNNIIGLNSSGDTAAGNGIGINFTTGDQSEGYWGDSDIEISGNTISSNQTAISNTNASFEGHAFEGIVANNNRIGVALDEEVDLGNLNGIRSDASMTITNNVISYSIEGGPSTGSGVDISGNSTITGNTFSNNTTALSINSISSMVANNSFSENTINLLVAGSNNEIGSNNFCNTSGGDIVINSSNLNIFDQNKFGNINDEGIIKVIGTSVNNAFTSNAFAYSIVNTIDLGDNGPTANDPGDADSGPNNLQNYPVNITLDGTQLDYTLDTSAGDYLVEFHIPSTVSCSSMSSLVCSDVITHAGGSQPYSLSCPGLPIGTFNIQALVAKEIAPDAYGDTSELSPIVSLDNPGPSNTPTPTNTPLPTVTNTPVPVPSDTPVPVPSSTTAPAVVSSPTLVPTLAGTRTPVPTASDTPTVTPTEGFVTSETTPVPSLTPVPTIVNPIVTGIPSGSTSYVPPEESVVNLPVVKSMSLALANSVQDVPVLGSLLDNAIEFSGRIKPLTDNLSYLLSLQFVGSSVASSGVTAINLLALAAPAIASAFAQPRLFYYALAWFWKRKSKLPWGIISDKFSHSPVAFARITLVKDGKRIDSQTTDLQGKYGFMADKGEYQIFITHPDYTDFSKEISVKYDGQTLAQDFELNSKAEQDFGSSLTWVFYQARKFIKQNLFILNTIIFSTGFVYTVFAVANSLTVFNYIILSLYLLQIVLIMVFYFTASKKWGQVLDVSTGEAIPGAIVRLLNNERQLDVAITDLQGRYNFILEPGEYYLKVSAPGYMFPTDDTPNVVVNQAGEKLMKFSVEKTERLSIKLYMQRFSNVQINRNTILSPFN